jgi:transcriptional regulator with XRE-family HTH domain
MPDASIFGKRLKMARDLRQMTQQQLSDKSKVPAVMISHFETGVRPSASADNLVKLANALEVSIDYLLGRTTDTHPRGGRVEAALLRTLEHASREQLDTVVRIAETIVSKDRPPKGR